MLSSKIHHNFKKCEVLKGESDIHVLTPGGTTRNPTFEDMNNNSLQKSISYPIPRATNTEIVGFEPICKCYILFFSSRAIWILVILVF